MVARRRNEGPQLPPRRARRLNGQGPEVVHNAQGIETIRRKGRKGAKPTPTPANVPPTSTSDDTDTPPPPLPVPKIAADDDRNAHSKHHDAGTQTHQSTLGYYHFTDTGPIRYADRPPCMVTVPHDGIDVPSILPNHSFSQQIESSITAHRALQQERQRHAEQSRLLTRFETWSFEMQSKLIEAYNDDDEDQTTHQRLNTLHRRQSKSRRDRQHLEERVEKAEVAAQTVQVVVTKALETIFVDCGLLPAASETFEKTSWDLDFDETYSKPTLSPPHNTAEGEAEVDTSLQTISSQVLAHIDAEQEVCLAARHLEATRAAFHRKHDHFSDDHGRGYMEASATSSHEHRNEALSETTSETDRRHLLTKMRLTSDLIEAEQALQAAEAKLAELQDSNHTPNSKTPTQTSFSRSSSPPFLQPACLHRSPSHTHITSWRRSIPSSISSSSPQAPLLLNSDEDKEDLPIRHKDNQLWGSISRAMYHIQPNAYREKIEEWEKHCEGLRKARRVDADV
ncbi:hypothetical protein Slin15195_G037100 [Septoria linicola]|uniref:Uncharacterized protein n=1 Tax=Septoria linicola TaxID=215465 RepID=A0A9Q9AQV0_9PEZI|nr:hypothetical protein Slin15195_G037100 [Septoria linicola]